MTLRIDKAGRVVIPKQVRDHWGLREGSAIELTESAEGVLLKPVDPEPPLVYVNGFPVFTGSLPEGYDWSRLVEDMRDDRIREQSGI